MYKEKTMAEKKIVLRILALALVFGLFVVGCNDGGTWKNVTSLADVTGTWKASILTEGDYDGVQINGTATDVSKGIFLLFDPDDEDHNKYTYTAVANTAGTSTEVKSTLTKIIVLDDVTVKAEVVVTVKINADGSATITEEETYTYSGDSLGQTFGRSYDDPTKTYTGWGLIKEVEYYAPSSTMTVNDTTYTVTVKSTSDIPAGTLDVAYLSSSLINADKTQLLTDVGVGVTTLFIKQ